MMNRSESPAASEVARIFREVFEEPDMPLAPGTSREQLPEWDSVAQVKLVLAMEEAFSIEFTTDEVASLHTVGGFVEALEKRGV